ncbi:unnamed protein product [Arctogadus glacialis]
MLDAGPHWTPAAQDRCLMLGLTGLPQHKTVSTLRSDLLRDRLQHDSLCGAWSRCCREGVSSLQGERLLSLPPELGPPGYSRLRL